MYAVEKGELCALGRGRVLSPFGLLFSAAGAIWEILGPVLEHRYFLVSGRMEFPFLVLPTFVAPSRNQREGAESQLGHPRMLAVTGDSGPEEAVSPSALSKAPFPPATHPDGVFMQRDLMIWNSPQFRPPLERKKHFCSKEER